MRTRAKTDTNQKGLVGYLRLHGASVQHLHTIGDGCPDLLVGFRGATGLAEVKYGNGSFTDDQLDWSRKWNGGPIWTLRDEGDADQMLKDLGDYSASDATRLLSRKTAILQSVLGSSIEGVQATKATRPRRRPKAPKAPRRGRT